MRLPYGTAQYPDLPGPEVRVEAFDSLAEQAMGSATTGIVDTGSVITCLPASVIDALGDAERFYGSATIIGALGDEEDVTTYYLDLRFGGREFRHVEVVAFGQPYAIIGRDILNDLHIALNGRDGEWTIVGP
jgi:predicted aspartyl protease